jgi:hypothetical protein
MRPTPLRIDLDGTGSEQLKSTFTLCLKCHDRTRVALIESNQNLTLANLLSRRHWAARVISASGKPEGTLMRRLPIMPFLGGEICAAGRGRRRALSDLQASIEQRME